jgi:hypothetical protein
MLLPPAQRLGNSRAIAAAFFAVQLTGFAAQCGFGSVSRPEMTA